MAARTGNRFRVQRFDFDELRASGWLVAGPLFFVGLVALYLLWHAFYTVEPHEQAVVLRFGAYQATAGPGLHTMVPLADEAVLVSVEEHSMRLPIAVDVESVRPTGNRSRGRDIIDDDTLMLTGDLNAAVVEWTVQWRVVDPAKYLFSIDQGHVEVTIRSVAQSVMNRLIGDYSIDEILTGKREEVGLEALEATQKILNGYECGVSITGLQMQRVTPPARVKPAFDAVNASIQMRDKLINEANRDRNKLIPQANANRDKLIREAQGYADRRTAEAAGEIAALRAKYQAYAEAPEVTRQRLYLEAMETVLTNAGAKVLLDADLKSILPTLELDETTRP